MQVRLFSELETEQGGVPVPVRGAKQRALLALLALRPGQPVSADRLIDVLWGDRQAAHPGNAPKGPGRSAAPHLRGGGDQHHRSRLRPGRGPRGRRRRPL